jgi:transposase-like protein
MVRPRAGTHYPGSIGDLRSWFQTDADCLDYLEWLRWPDGFVCPVCGQCGGWRIGDGRFKCSACGFRSSVTAGTIFDRTRTPLTVWFAAAWHFATAKNGISALTLQRTLEIGSYQTAWAMLHRFRSVLLRPGREPLSGTVEVDETYIGGVEPGLAGGRAKGKKILTGIAVEVHEPCGMGRCRMVPLPDASARTLTEFVRTNVAPGSTVITDGWSGYKSLSRIGYVHDLRSQRAAKARGEDPGSLLPAVHRVASLSKRWLLGTHQGAVEDSHLPAYLNEFVFRFNRRTSRSRDCCSCGSWSWLFLTRLLGTTSYWRVADPGRSRPPLPGSAASRRAYSAQELSGPGGLRNLLDMRQERHPPDWASLR